MKFMHKKLALALSTLAIVVFTACADGGGGGGGGTTIDNVVVNIKDSKGSVSSTTYLENNTDVFIMAAVNQTSTYGPQTGLSLLGIKNLVIMSIGYLGAGTGLKTFNAGDTTGAYIDPNYAFYIESGAAPTAGSIDVTTYGAVGGVFAGTYNMDLCGLFDIFGEKCDATTVVNFAGSFSAQVEDNIGSQANPYTITSDGMGYAHGMDSTLATNFYWAYGFTPGSTHPITLAGLSSVGDLDLALLDSAGTVIPCDLLSNIGNGVGLAEECRFTAGARGDAYFKVSHVAGAALETYDISIGRYNPGGGGGGGGSHPDLIVEITGATYDAGLDALTINYTITNNGLSDLYLSMNRGIDVEGFFNPGAVPLVGAWGTQWVTHNTGIITNTGGLVTGTMVIPGNGVDTTGTAYVIVDTQNLEGESDETNNVSAGFGW